MYKNEIDNIIVRAMINLSALNSSCELALFLGVSILCVLVTIVFCFWCIYLLDAMKRKWKFYRNTSDCLERDENNQKEIMAYNAKTEFTKHVFLFFINLLEWVALIAAALAFLPSLILTFDEFISKGENSTSSSDDNDLSEQKHMRYLISSLPFRNWSISCIILSLVLIASLCMYLSARQAKLSWMKSNKIPYLIAFFLISLILTQTISGIYSTVNILISSICYTLLLISAMVILTKQYRKLLMVINWSIVDLQTSGNIHLLKRQIQMKRRFIRTFKFLLVTFCLLLLVMILGLTLHSMALVYTTHSSDDIIERIFHHTFGVFYLANLTIGLMTTMSFFIPYIGFGLSTMYVILWRLINGKTGYQTHFRNPLNTP